MSITPTTGLDVVGDAEIGEYAVVQVRHEWWEFAVALIGPGGPIMKRWPQFGLAQAGCVMSLRRVIHSRQMGRG